MINLSRDTLALLDDIEARIDPETEEDFAARWEDFLFDRFEGDIFSPHRKKLTAPGTELPNVHINDALADYEQMLVSQMAGVSAALNGHSNLCVRANYGSAIMSSLFGAEIFIMPRETNTLPTTKGLNSTEKIEELIQKGIPDLNTGFGRRVFEFGEICAELWRKYPKIGKYVTVYHPDTQGPLDIAELLWGCDMFYAMYDEPETVHQILQLVTDTYTAFLNKWYEIFPKETRLNVHWANLRHRGTILLRDDSAMNLSPEFYKEFAAPYDGELLRRFDGGAVHFCGRGDHYIETLSQLPGLYGINMSQPEMNKMEIIYQNTVDKGIPILGFSREWAEKDKNREGGFHHHLSV